MSALAFSNLKPAAELITRALADKDWMVREVAAETLGTNANGAQAADPLIKAIADEFWQVRLKAVRSLGRMRIARAVEAIGPCLQHPQANLRKEGAAALGEIADPAGLREEFLEAVFDDPDPEVRKNARPAYPADPAEERRHAVLKPRRSGFVVQRTRALAAVRVTVVSLFLLIGNSQSFSILSPRLSARIVIPAGCLMTVDCLAAKFGTAVLLSISTSSRCRATFRLISTKPDLGTQPERPMPQHATTIASRGLVMSRAG